MVYFKMKKNYPWKKMIRAVWEKRDRKAFATKCFTIEIRAGVQFQLKRARQVHEPGKATLQHLLAPIEGPSKVAEGPSREPIEKPAG